MFGGSLKTPSLSKAQMGVGKGHAKAKIFRDIFVSRIREQIERRARQDKAGREPSQLPAPGPSWLFLEPPEALTG